MKLNNAFILVLISFITILSGCTNGGGKKALKTTLSQTSSAINSAAPTSNPNGLSNQYTINQVVILPNQSQPDQPPVTTILFNQALTARPLTTFCLQDNACFCQFKWEETNNLGSSSVTVSRVAQTPVQPSLVDSYAVGCLAPQAYKEEIQIGQTIEIKLVSPTFSELKTNTVVFTNGTFASGDALSVDPNNSNGPLSALRNIRRYVCYEKIRRGIDVKNTIGQLSDEDFGTHRFVMGSRFCPRKFGGSFPGKTDQVTDNTVLSEIGCSSSYPDQSEATVYSSQSNYVNLYIPSDDLGNISDRNDAYVCPRVYEKIADINSGVNSDFYPLDTTFSLAKNKSPLFNVPIETQSILGKSGNDEAKKNTFCSGDEATESSDSGLATKCLGFALKPNNDGSCPKIPVKINTSSATQLVNTYRLRRYLTVYPISYDTDGRVLESGARSADEIYVMDREVQNSIVSADNAPFTMLGPKPCPFSYFDRKGSTEKNQSFAVEYGLDGVPSYVATNDPAWDGKNVDGTHFPNKDQSFSSLLAPGSCAATLPIPNMDDFGDLKGFSLATTYPSNTQSVKIGYRNLALNKVYVRPQEPWAPHYVEDQSFDACAPPAFPTIVDPPLHFAKKVDPLNPAREQFAYCAAVYPTQNPAVTSIDQNHASSINPHPGRVIPFTSPTVKNSTSAECSASTNRLTLTNYPDTVEGEEDQDLGIGLARHPTWLDWDGKNASVTCDRTVNIDANDQFINFPLQAPPAQIEQALLNDNSYQCTVTHDLGAKKGTATPEGGCCGPGRVYFDGRNPAAHLEPFTVPTGENHGFCGKPIYKY